MVEINQCQNLPDSVSIKFLRLCDKIRCHGCQVQISINSNYYHLQCQELLRSVQYLGILCPGILRPGAMCPGMLYLGIMCPSILRRLHSVWVYYVEVYLIHVYFIQYTFTGMLYPDIPCPVFFVKIYFVQVYFAQLNFPQVFFS